MWATADNAIAETDGEFAVFVTNHAQSSLAVKICLSIDYQASAGPLVRPMLNLAVEQPCAPQRLSHRGAVEVARRFLEVLKLRVTRTRCLNWGFLFLSIEPWSFSIFGERARNQSVRQARNREKKVDYPART